jgi:hypothetical protein
MERELAPLLNLRFEQGLRAAQMSGPAPALEHWFAEREPERQRWRFLSCSLNSDYCPEQCCRMMTMTWALEPNRPKFSQSTGRHSGYEGHAGVVGSPRP